MLFRIFKQSLFHIIPGTDTKHAELSFLGVTLFSFAHLHLSPLFFSRNPLRFVSPAASVGFFTLECRALGPRNISSFQPVTMHCRPTGTDLKFEAPARWQKLKFQPLQQNSITCPYPTPAVLTSLFVVTELPTHPPPSISRG